MWCSTNTPMKGAWDKQPDLAGSSSLSTFPFPQSEDNSTVSRCQDLIGSRKEHLMTYGACDFLYCLHTAVGLVQEAESHPVRFSRRETEAVPANHLSADTIHIEKQARKFLKPCFGPLLPERTFGFLEEERGKGHLGGLVG